MSNDLLLWLLLIGVALNLALGLWLLLRRAPVDAQELAHRERLLDQVQQQGQQVGQRVERVESELRREISEQSRGGRQEMQQTLATFQETLSRQEAEATRTQNAQLDAFALQLVQLRGTLGDTLTRQLQDMSEGNARRLAEIRTTLDAQLAQL
ncbi:MAG: DNA recombination protein RmuC, partial [Ferrovibrionaceae bacterium]